MEVTFNPRKPHRAHMEALDKVLAPLREAREKAKAASSERGSGIASGTDTERQGDTS